MRLGVTEYQTYQWFQWHELQPAIVLAYTFETVRSPIKMIEWRCDNSTYPKDSNGTISFVNHLLQHIIPLDSAPLSGVNSRLNNPVNLNRSKELLEQGWARQPRNPSRVWVSDRVDSVDKGLETSWKHRIIGDIKRSNAHDQVKSDLRKSNVSQFLIYQRLNSDPRTSWREEQGSRTRSLPHASIFRRHSDRINGITVCMLVNLLPR